MIIYALDIPYAGGYMLDEYVVILVRYKKQACIHYAQLKCVCTCEHTVPCSIPSFQCANRINRMYLIPLLIIRKVCINKHDTCGGAR
jgi:hypothetical protein